MVSGTSGKRGGPRRRSSTTPHNDFNDEALRYGASYWARLVERLLPAR